ncbi:unnamed protein product [Diatraea saccharalis]|uniref:ZAD domain-containing protein n=1 Tax=Diatraea saccharalis TaxID=40085 RepID=A0A9N9R6G1_9NEOP|nr:unnamed protein product [Diatraea saccharalis]
MDDSSELVLKKICCTCLSRDRKLSQLCRLKEGINNLYLLLSQDSEAYREGFYKDTASWHICWECWAIMRRISSFQSQACIAQRHLTGIVEGRTDVSCSPVAKQKEFCTLTFVHTDIVNILSLLNCDRIG